MRRRAGAAFLFTLGFLLFHVGLEAQARFRKGERLTDEHGLSQNTIFCILQDRKGFLWVGTEDGLNRYDGYGFKVFNHDPSNPNSLSSGNIKCLAEDRSGTLWIGTETGGLNALEQRTGKLTPYVHDPRNPKSLSNDDVRSIWPDKDGNLWVGTLGGGLNEWNARTRAFRKHPSAASNILCMFPDPQGKLWMGTEGGGLQSFDTRTKSFGKAYRRKPGHPAGLSNDTVSALHLDRKGRLWVGTLGGGLNVFQPESGAFRRISGSPANITSIGEDAAGNVYVGSEEGGGLCVVSPSSFSCLRILREELESGNINVLFFGQSGKLWLGTHCR